MGNFQPYLFCLTVGEDVLFFHHYIDTHMLAVVQYCMLCLLSGLLICILTQQVILISTFVLLSVAVVC